MSRARMVVVEPEVLLDGAERVAVRLLQEPYRDTVAIDGTDRVRTRRGLRPRPRVPGGPRAHGSVDVADCPQRPGARGRPRVTTGRRDSVPGGPSSAARPGMRRSLAIPAPTPSPRWSRPRRSKPIAGCGRRTGWMRPATALVALGDATAVGLPPVFVAHGGALTDRLATLRTDAAEAEAEWLLADHRLEAAVGAIERQLEILAAASALAGVDDTLTRVPLAAAGAASADPRRARRQPVRGAAAGVVGPGRRHPGPPVDDGAGELPGRAGLRRLRPRSPRGRARRRTRGGSGGGGRRAAGRAGGVGVEGPSGAGRRHVSSVGLPAAAPARDGGGGRGLGRPSRRLGRSGASCRRIRAVGRLPRSGRCAWSRPSSGRRRRRSGWRPGSRSWGPTARRCSRKGCRWQRRRRRSSGRAARSAPGSARPPCACGRRSAGCGRRGSWRSPPTRRSRRCRLRGSRPTRSGSGPLQSGSGRKTPDSTRPTPEWSRPAQGPDRTVPGPSWPRQRRCVLHQDWRCSMQREEQALRRRGNPSRTLDASSLHGSIPFWCWTWR